MYKGNTLDDINRKKICKKLFSYYLEGGDFIEECIDIREEASDLTNKPFDEFDRSIFKKTLVFEIKELIEFHRKLIVDRLSLLKKQYMHRYNNYTELFVYANKILEQNNIDPVIHDNINEEINFEIDNGIENDNWLFDVSYLIEQLIDFMHSKNDIAFLLRCQLQTLDPSKTWTE